MLAIIGGSGLVGLPGMIVAERRPAHTPYGTSSAPLCLGRVGAHALVFLARHGDPHAIPPHCINYRANLRALADAGVDRVLAVNAVGGIHAGMQAPGHFVVPHDLVDYTWGREHTFSDGAPGSVLHHVDVSEPFDARLRANLLSCLARAGLPHSAHGVYAVAQGPRWETAAEVRRYERDGCDIVGMTAMPEAGLARELGLRYAMLCLVVNPAAGKGARQIEQAAILRTLGAAQGPLQAVLADFVAGDD